VERHIMPTTIIMILRAVLLFFILTISSKPALPGF
jgi:hypothetical protein